MQHDCGCGQGGAPSRRRCWSVSFRLLRRRGQPRPQDRNKDFLFAAFSLNSRLPRTILYLQVAAVTAFHIVAGLRYQESSSELDLRSATGARSRPAPPRGPHTWKSYRDAQHSQERFRSQDQTTTARTIAAKATGVKETTNNLEAKEEADTGGN